jgi:tRNA A-37 threonylcarbamoyl transferase component Bud32
VTGGNRQVPEIPGYRHVRLISDAGGYGDVHLYTDTELDREVAVKVIREADLSPAAVQRFMAEATAMAGLEHPHIVRVYGAGRTTDGRPYLTMQHCPEASMEVRARQEHLGVAEVLRIGISIGSAVETAHRAGLLHRDIKPANILTARWGAPGLTDFGVAARVSSGAADQDDVGVSPPWSPPEMLYTATQGTPSSDVYSLAATLWHLLVGRSPFEIPGGDNSRMAIMSRVRDLPPPVTGRSDVPSALDGLLRRAMAKDPARRPQTMVEFVSGLQAVESQRGLHASEAVYLGATVDRPADSASESVVEAGTRLRPGRAGAPAGTRQPVGATAVDIQATRLRASRAADPVLDEDRMSGVVDIQVPVRADPVPSAVSRRLLAWPAVVLVLAGAVLAYWLAARGRTAGPAGTAVPTASASMHQVGPGSDDLIPPGPVTVTGRRSRATAMFTWDYSALLSTDTYRWEVVGGPHGVATKPTVTLPARTGTPVCLHVIVVRADGSFATRQWSPAGCA